MADQRMPGARYIARRNNRNMLGGPSRVTHHITWDVINKDGTRAVTLDGVSNYLLNKGYEPQLVIDPFTGDRTQLLDASSSGYALENNGIQTNRRGTVNIQVEWLFTPGTVYDGVRYDSLTDTPMLGLSELLEWADSWDIPRVAPLGVKDRNPDVWANHGGHYGHFNAPLNSHVDPIVSIQSILDKVTGEAPAPAPEPGEPPTPCEAKVFGLGDDDRCVIYIQRLLNRRGFGLVDDGDFGPRTKEAVIQFQLNHRLVADGVVGANTWKALWWGQTL